MIRAVLTPKGGEPESVILGLDEENIKRLREGKPINVNLRHLDPDGPPTEKLPNLNIVIAYDNNDFREFLEKAREKTAG
jgi:hypothetical protein